MSLLEELKSKLEHFLNEDITASEKGDIYFFEISSYCESNKINFHKLMEIGKIFGTLDFDINDEFHPGITYSEYTKDADIFIKRYVVAINKINTGLPWEATK